MIYYIAAVHVLLWGILLANLLYLKRTRRLEQPAEWPTVSILIPARNEAHNLPRLLDSLLAQSYPHTEIIVYDDGSEDETGSIIASYAPHGVIGLHGSGPPAGWVGKVHALFQATRSATGDLFLFLDADAELLHPEALQKLVERFVAQPGDTVLTVLPRLRGGGLLLVSLVPQTILTSLPWPLVRPSPFAALGALNGQCWMIRAADYRRLEPHRQVKDEVLEDVNIGRYLKAHGLIPVMHDMKREVAVSMYRDVREAWQGFRKNAYLLAGGHPLIFIPLYVSYFLVLTICYLFSPWFLVSLYLLKLTTDRHGRFPLWVSLLTPLTFVLASLLQLHSALSHWTGRVAWKGRRVGSGAG